MIGVAQAMCIRRAARPCIFWGIGAFGSSGHKEWRKVAEVFTIQAAATRADFEADLLPRSQVYEITFAGQAGSVLHAEFDDCEVSAGEDTTTLRVELPDQAALWGLLQRMMDFGLKLIELRLVAVPSATSGDGSAGPGSPVG
jgi:hypothetical protein